MWCRFWAGLFLCGIAAFASADDSQLIIYGELTPGLAHQDAAGHQSGVLIDIVTALQRRTGHQQPLHMVPWVRGYSYTTRNDKPVALFATAFNEERRQLFYWLGPLIDVQWCFSVLDASPLASLSLQQARELVAIGVVKNDAREASLRKLGFNNLVTVESDDENVRMLQRGRISAWLSSTITDKLHLSKVGLGTESIRHLHCFDGQGLYLTFNRVTRADTVSQWRAAFSAMRSDGELARILAAYDLELPVSQVKNLP